jgi:hypothetical protein
MSDDTNSQFEIPRSAYDEKKEDLDKLFVYHGHPVNELESSDREIVVDTDIGKYGGIGLRDGLVKLNVPFIHRWGNASSYTEGTFIHIMGKTAELKTLDCEAVVRYVLPDVTPYKEDLEDLRDFKRLSEAYQEMVIAFNPWGTIDDAKVRHIWRQSDGTEVAIPPTFYEESGTPVEDSDSEYDGDDLTYVRTEILKD